jgi:hypothetical protein
MQRGFIGLLVGICLLFFTSPLLAADTFNVLSDREMSTLQELDDAQLGQINGTGVFTNAWKSQFTARLATVTHIIPRLVAAGVGPISPPPDVPAYKGLVTMIIPRLLDRFGPDDPWEMPALPVIPRLRFAPR